MSGTDTETVLARLGRQVEDGAGLGRAAYVDPVIFALERERVFRGGWIALLFAHQVAEAGDQVPVEAAGLPLVAVRDREGGVRVFHNVCRHRAALVVPAPVRGQPTLRCPYHGWAYALDGTLRATPLWDGRKVTPADALDRTAAGLQEVRSHVFADMVWIDLSGHAAPFGTFAAPIMNLWARYDMEAFRLAHYETGQIAANWKLAAEAAVENYHEAFVHPRLPARVDAAGQPSFADVADGAMFGFTTAAESPLRSETPFVPFRDGAAGARTDNLCFLFPNGQLNLFGGLAVRTVWMPLALDRTEWRTSWYLIGEAATSPALAAARADMLGLWRALRAEDKAAIETMHAARASPVADTVLLSPFWERSVGAFHRLWVARMQQAAEAGAQAPVPALAHPR